MHPVVVLAGGLGTRVAHLTGPDVPKALLPLDGRAFVDFKLAGLAAQGVTDVVMLVGHGAGPLREHVGDGRRFGLQVAFVDDGPALRGTAGAIRAALDRITGDFWVTYGDTLLDVPMAGVEARLAREPELLGVMTVLANRDRWETSNVDVERDVDGGLVVAYEKGGTPGAHVFIDYGMLLFRRAAFDGSADDSPDGPADLGDLVRALIGRRRLGAFEVSERFHDVGTEAAWRETDEWVRTRGLWSELERAIAGRGGA